MLYPGSGRALYLQLEEILRQGIESGQYRKGDKLPSERSLSETYGISRMTVRAALNELVSENLLESRRGSGYYVSSGQIENNLDRMQGFIEELQAKNINFSVNIAEKEYTPADRKTAHALGLNAGDTVFKLRRLVSIHDEPISIDRTYLPVNVAYPMEQMDLQKIVLYDYLEHEGYRLIGADQTISAGVLTEDEAKKLEREAGFPVLIIDRTAFVEGHLPLVYSHTIYLSDKYHYTLTLRR